MQQEQMKNCDIKTTTQDGSSPKAAEYGQI